MKNKFAGIVIVGLVLSVVLALFVSPFASGSPDGFESAMEEVGIEGAVEESKVDGVIPDYIFPGIENRRVATGLAGLVGVLIVFLGAVLLGKLLARKNQNKEGATSA